MELDRGHVIFHNRQHISVTICAARQCLRIKSQDILHHCGIKASFEISVIDTARVSLRGEVMVMLLGKRTERRMRCRRIGRETELSGQL
jgi:hypothetical protein